MQCPFLRSMEFIFCFLLPSFLTQLPPSLPHSPRLLAPRKVPRMLARATRQLYHPIFLGQSSDPKEFDQKANFFGGLPPRMAWKSIGDAGKFFWGLATSCGQNSTSHATRNRGSQSHVTMTTDSPRVSILSYVCVCVEFPGLFIQAII